MEDDAMEVQPGRSLGFMTLGSSLHEVLTAVKADVKAYPKISLIHDEVHPLDKPVLIELLNGGLRLQFDGPDQRLRLVEVLDFRKLKLVYKNVEVFKPADGSSLSGPTGPTFKHIYDKVLGPTYPGEYIEPDRKKGGNAEGTYNLSYPGIAFNFPLTHSAFSPNKDVTTLLSSSAAGPAKSMAIFSGESWQKARGTLFSATPLNPRNPLLATKGNDGRPDEIEIARILGAGRIELVRRSSPPFMLVLSETTPQDLITELGAPDAIHKKNDHRLQTHKDRRESDASDRSAVGFTADDFQVSEQGSALGTDNEDDWEDEDDDEAEEEARDREVAAAEHFYCYYHHGFDILISKPTSISPAPPTWRPIDDDEADDKLTAQPLNHMTATKLILHGNVPGSYQFNRHRRSRWTLEHKHTDLAKDALNSESSFGDISARLKKVCKSFYENAEQERLWQRPMALNRGWGDSPGSSVELLGGWEDGSIKKGKSANKGSRVADDSDMGNVELYGFPGMIFEVLKNGAVAVFTVD